MICRTRADVDSERDRERRQTCTLPRVPKTDDLTSCPICGSGGVPVLYGLPALEAAKAEQEGRIALGGCVVFDEGPMWECRGPGRHRWSDEDAALWRSKVDAAVRGRAGT